MYACALFSAPTSTGLEEYTISGLGWTPKAARFTCNGGVVDGTAREAAQIVIGATDATREWVTGIQDQNNQATTSCGIIGRTDACVGALYTTANAGYGSGVGDGSAGNPGPISNGWRVNWTSAPDQAYLLFVEFFSYDNVYVGEFTGSGTQDSAATISAPGFQGNMLFLCSNWASDSLPYLVGTVRLSIGIAVDSVDQLAVAHRSGNGTGAQQLSGYVETSYSGREITATATDYGSDVAFTASGFTVTPRDADSDADHFFYLLLDTGRQSAWCGILDSPTSAASDWSVTAPGFRPEGAGLILNNASAVDTLTNSGITCEALGVSAFDGTRAIAASVSMEDAADPTVTRSICQAGAFRTLDGALNDIHDADGVPTFNASGWTLASSGIQTANGTARKWGAWAIEGGPPKGGLALMGVGR